MIKNKLFNIGLMMLLSVALVSAVTFVSWNSGTFNNTFYNETGDYVQLNSSETNGTYISPVIDMGANTRFDNLTWIDNASVEIDCPTGMAYIDKLGGYCIDKYEAHAVSGSTDEPYGVTSSTSVTSTVLSGGGYAGSAAGESPWVYITQTQAKTACENAGKRLCSNDEWQAAANIHGDVYNLANDLGTSPNYCVTNSGTYCASGNSYHADPDGYVCLTGYYSGGLNNCASDAGVYDMVGNVWEWVDEVWSFSRPSGCSASAWCYLQDDGTWSSSGDSLYGADGVYYGSTYTDRALLRGGPRNDEAYAGVFAGVLAHDASYTTDTVGFRCCSS